MARTIVIDIETHKSRDEKVIERIRQEAFTKAPAKSASKATKLEFASEEAAEERFQEAWSKTAVDPMLAEILLVMFSEDLHEAEEFSVQRVSEGTMLEQLAARLDNVAGPETIWVGHNIEGFDLPVMLNRWRRFGITPPKHFPNFQRGRWAGRVFDTMLRTPARTPFVSMEAACEAVGIAMNAVLWQGEPMHGGRVEACYAAGDWETLLTYCEEDVVTTAKLYLAMTFQDSWGTFPRMDLRERLLEIEQDRMLTAGQKAIAQIDILKGVGQWPA
jgi:hypothetical protein